MQGVDVTRHPDRCVYVCERGEWEIVLERFQESKDGTAAEVTVRSTAQPRPGLLGRDRLNLLARQSKAVLAKELAAEREEIDWRDVLTQIADDALEYHRRGEPSVNLDDVQPREGSRWLYKPWIEYGGPTVLFATGGTGKSLFGLAIAVSVAQGIGLLGGHPEWRCPVLYLDWEADADTHAERKRAIQAGAKLRADEPGVQQVRHRRMESSLADGLYGVQAEIEEHGIGLVVLDSMAMARGGEPENAMSTIQLFRAIRQLRTPTICIDHVTKNGGDDQADPFGSIYTRNSSRLMWSMHAAEEMEAADGTWTVALKHRKANNVKFLGRRAYEVALETDDQDNLLSARYKALDPSMVPSVLQRMSRRDQIASVLRRLGAMTAAQVRDHLAVDGVEVDQTIVRAELNRLKGKAFVQLDDGSQPRWGLLAGREYNEA